MRISDWSSDVCSSDLLPDQWLSSAALSSRRGPIRGTPSVPTGRERGDMGLTPAVGGKRPGGRAGDQGRHPPFQSQATHRGTPPEDVMVSRQVSWLAGRRPPLPPSRSLKAQWRMSNGGSPLTVAGAAPASPSGSPDSLLAPAPGWPGEPRPDEV